MSTALATTWMKRRRKLSQTWPMLVSLSLKKPMSHSQSLSAMMTAAATGHHNPHHQPLPPLHARTTKTITTNSYFYHQQRSRFVIQSWRPNYLHPSFIVYSKHTHTHTLIPFLIHSLIVFVNLSCVVFILLPLCHEQRRNLVLKSLGCMCFCHKCCL